VSAVDPPFFGRRPNSDRNSISVPAKDTQRLGAPEDIDAFTVKYSGHLIGDVWILASHDLGAAFDDRHAAAEAAEGLRHLDARIAPAKHDQARRHLIELERFDMHQRLRRPQAVNVWNSSVRADVDHSLIAAKHARAAAVQRHLEGFWANETAVAHDELGTGLVVSIQMKELLNKPCRGRRGRVPAGGSELMSPDTMLEIEFIRSNARQSTPVRHARVDAVP
jgi:hypothetical protein